MKALLYAILVASLVSAMSARGNTPSTGLKPQTVEMKEWWRVDDKGYGVAGMTWLDNFYNGKGVLVVSTPSGVQSWQLRYPGDTENVFTWLGGDANIKQGDFNGDGQTDYIDGKGNIYAGQANGQPPMSEPIVTINQAYPYLIADIDDDGKYDMIDFGSTTPTANVSFGQTNLNFIHRSPYSIVGIDSANGFLHAYKTANNDLRLVLSHWSWQRLKDPPYVRQVSDGIRLVGLHWDQTSRSFISTILADTSWQTLDSNDIRVTSQMSFANGRPECLMSTLLGGNIWKSMLKTIDLSGDSISVISSLRLDSVRSIVPLTCSLDYDSINTLCIVKSDPWYVNLYRGNTDVQLAQIGSINKSAPAYRVLAIPKSDERNHASIIIAGTYALQGDEASAISFSSLIDTVADLVTQPEDTTLQLTVINSRSNNERLDFKVNTLHSGCYNVTVSDLNGHRVEDVENVFLSAGNQDVAIPLKNGPLVAGVYTLTVHDPSIVKRLTFVVQ